MPRIGVPWKSSLYRPDFGYNSNSVVIGAMKLLRHGSSLSLMNMDFIFCYKTIKERTSIHYFKAAFYNREVRLKNLESTSSKVKSSTFLKIFFWLTVMFYGRLIYCFDLFNFYVDLTIATRLKTKNTIIYVLYTTKVKCIFSGNQLIPI